MPSAIEEIRCTGHNIDLPAMMDRAQPLVLRGLCPEWPLVRLARQSDSAFAQELARHDNGTPVDALLMAPDADGILGYNAAMDGFNYEHFRVPVTLVLQRLAQYSRQEGARGLAMQSAPIANCLPGLLPAHRLPFLDASVQPRLWLGNRVTTPAHFDSTHNIAVVACGRRRFTLFPPGQVENLYIGPLDFAPTAAAISLPRIDAAGDPRWPRLAQALAHALASELAPGDAIYIPPLWWHHVVSLEPLNALVNWWWHSGPAAEPGLNALMHCILAYKSLPPAERAAWKTLLEHYVFGDADPAGHIPAERRGVLGPLTPEMEARLRKLIRPES